MQLISAQGEQAVKVALAGHQGVLEQKIIHIREMLITTAAHLSAWADYPEDDIPQLQPKVLKDNLYRANEQIEQLLSQFDAGKAIRGRSQYCNCRQTQCGKIYIDEFAVRL